MPQIGYAHRPVAMGREGLVASAHPLATLAGVETLKAGGNAADAVVAVNAVLAVTQPYCCGLGGDLFALYYDAASRRVHFLNGSGRSGARATLGEVERRGWTAMPIVGPAAVSVPGCAAAWTMLLERFGTRALADLLQPAIHHAARGFPTTLLVSQAIAEMAPRFDDPEWHRVFAPAGRPHAPGDLLVQTDLAQTLRALAADGPEVVYRGRVAEATARRLEADGFLTPDDLAAHRGEWDAPITTTYRGTTLYQTPPPTQGVAALLAMNLLEGFPVARMSLGSPEHLHVVIEMVKLAYADRDRWIADPAHACVPVAGLLSKAYAERRRRAFDPKKAQAHAGDDPDGDTTGFVVADGQGNVASIIQSLYNSFGAGVVPPGTGVVLQNRGRHFSLDPAHPNVLAPRKRPFHTLVASLAIRDDRPVMAFATMGGSGQAMFHAQVLPSVLDHDVDIQEAIERPRFVLGPLAPDDAPDTVHIEERVGRRVLTALTRRGHRVRPVSAFFHRCGHAHGIVVRDGLLTGGADPRGDGLALGF